MKKSMKAILSASVAALCVFGVGLSANAYELNTEVKDVTPALREASTIGVWHHSNPDLQNLKNKDAILVMTFGTTFADTRAKTIDAVEAAIQKLILISLSLKHIHLTSLLIGLKQKKVSRR